jgi:transcription initiation factor TFIIB
VLDKTKPVHVMAYSQPFPLALPAEKKTQPSFGPDLAVRLICPECGDPNPNIVEEFGSGDLVCGNCGLVLGDRIVDTRSEWRVCEPRCNRTLVHVYSDLCQ